MVRKGTSLWIKCKSVGFLILAVFLSCGTVFYLAGKVRQCGDKEGKKRALIFILLKMLVLKNTAGLISVAGTRYQIQEVSGY